METKKKSSNHIEQDAYDGADLPAERISQLNTIQQILEESLDKLKISLILPKIFENPIILDKYLGNTDHEECIRLLHEYKRQTVLQGRRGKPHLDYRLIKLIDYFHEHTEILQCLPLRWLEDIDGKDKSLLESFSFLQKITKERLKKSASKELEKEKQIHEMYHENQTFKKTIQKLQNQLRHQRINMRWKLAAKEGMIQKYEEDLAYSKYNNNIRVKQEILNSSKSIRQIHSTSIQRQRELQVELDSAKVKYDALLKENLKQEKNARDEKNKLFLQLQTLIKKFDQVIGDRTKENRQLQEEYEKQKTIFEEFMVIYRQEDEVYDRIVRQKEEEEKRQRQEKIIYFMMNRSAKIIQRQWRKYRGIDVKKKGKKGKKKK